MDGVEVSVMGCFLFIFPGQKLTKNSKGSRIESVFFSLTSSKKAHFKEMNNPFYYFSTNHKNQQTSLFEFCCYQKAPRNRVLFLFLLIFSFEQNADCRNQKAKRRNRQIMNF